MTDENVQNIDATTEQQATVDTTPVQQEQVPAQDKGTIEGGNAVPDTPADDAQGKLQQLRELLSGGDEKELKLLERYKTAEGIRKAFKEGRQSFHEKRKPLSIDEKATPEQIKEYREAMGIPEDAKDYPVNFGEGFKASEHDSALLDSFKSHLHSNNVPPKAAQVALEWWQDMATKQAQDQAIALTNRAKQTQSELREEWGGEYDGNINAANHLLATHLGEEGVKELMQEQLIDGSRLQDHKGLVKLLATLGADYYGGTAIYNGDVEANTKTLEERKNELMNLRNSDPRKYKTEEVQSELNKIYGQLAKVPKKN